MIFWLACAAPHTEVVETDRTDTDAGVDTEVKEEPAFVEPPTANDLDPEPNVLHVALEMAPTDDGGLAFNRSIPGPTLRAVIGDTVVVDITNALSEDTTVHWHGLSVPWSADGVTWLQDPIVPGETRTVRFVLDRAGTFWYHPHFDSGLGQVRRGLYGVVVVEDPADPAVDIDSVWVFDQGPGSEGEDEHEQHLDPWRVNGVYDPKWALEPGTVVRARLVNTSEGGYLDLRDNVDPTWIAGDQGLFAGDRKAAEGLVLGPGDRAELVYAVGDDVDVMAGPYTMHGGVGWGEPERVLHIDTPEPGDEPAVPAFAFSGNLPTPDAGEAPDVIWVFSGDGEEWFMNGEQFPDVTVPEVALGDTILVEVRNLSPTEHPFHLHGMPFEVLSVDGVAPEGEEIEDTVNLPIRSVVRLRVVANNPGDWMAHCHILPHAHGGMMTVLRVNP